MRKEIKSTCCYCGVGCGVLIEVDQEHIVGVRGDPEHPANFGRLCTKGATLHLASPEAVRLQHPTLQQRATGGRTETSWASALDQAAGRFADIIRQHGPDSVAFYISGQLMTEDYYVFNKLAKGLIGTNNVDTNSRLCMSSAVAGYKQTLGADAPPCCYDDIGLADVLVIAGANPAVAHPIVFRRIEDAKAANPNLRIVVIDPRRSETAELADLHLALTPGTDIALYNGMLHVLIAEGMIDRAYIDQHTEGFEALAHLVKEYTPQRVGELCGLSPEAVRLAARWFGQAQAPLSLYCQGLNQSAHGTHNNAALIHLHLATGQIGRPGAGPFSLTGQPNAMGGREVGGLANLLSAHRDLANPEHRAEVARLWGIERVPEQPGKAAVQLFQAIRRGEIKAVWIACTNPAQSLPFQAEVRAALQQAEYVVVQEAFAHTDTTAYADLLLPASAWGEKHGTVTNSERRISRVFPAVPPPGQARHDWQIVVDFAHRLSTQLGSDLGQRLFPYATPEEIFNEHRESTRGRDLDIAGLSYALLAEAGPQQWPMPEGQAAGTERLYADGVFPTGNGRARFVLTAHQEASDAVLPERPIRLLSGRMRDHWHGMSRTGTVPRLFNLEDEPLLSLHPCDMRHRQLGDGDLAEVENARGKIIVRVRAASGLVKGRAWMPMHWGSQFASSPGVNALACDATDGYSAQPELKHTTVQVRKANLPYPLAIVRRCASQEAALRMQQAAKPLLAAFPYATLGLYGRGSALVVFRAALAEPPTAEVLAELDRVFDLTAEDGAIRYADQARQVFKKALTTDGRLQGVRLAGEALAQAWLKQAMAEDELDPALIRQALAPSNVPPVSVAARQIVCKCADISDAQIRAEMAAGAGFAQLQEKLKCGTFCGACVPEIKNMLLETTAKAD